MPGIKLNYFNAAAGHEGGERVCERERDGVYQSEARLVIYTRRGLPRLNGGGMKLQQFCTYSLIRNDLRDLAPLFIRYTRARRREQPPV